MIEPSARVGPAAAAVLTALLAGCTTEVIDPLPITGGLDVTTVTTGVDPDTDGYTVTVDGTQEQAISSNATVTFSAVPAGDRSVELSGLSDHCAADQNPQTVTVVRDQGVALTFTVTCAPVLVGAGDIARCSLQSDDATADLLDDISGTVFTAGDNVYSDGTAEEFADCYDPTWGRHKSRTRPAAGNHDYNTTDATGYYGYFGALAGDPAKGYYSYDLEGWHVVVLNSNIARDEASPQITWLVDDLAASAATCTVAYWHHSRFSSGYHGDNPSMGPMWDALYAAGVEIVVTGHDHHYERFAPQTPAGEPDPSAGIRGFVVGTGGTDLRPAFFVKANSEVRNAVTHGVLKLTLRVGAYDWEFIPVAGQAFTDVGSGVCH